MDGTSEVCTGWLLSVPLDLVFVLGNKRAETPESNNVPAFSCM
ncbi:hypothetical protein PARMER_03968 [Parabacteroides merdae ATCC 43184]|nr:hypothetical protein PARMER_03968 [Parabacteroides merdae ATCC 43184]